MPDMLNNRERLPARDPSKCLKGRSYGERRAKEASLELQDAQKKTDRAITFVTEAVRVPAHLAPPGSPQAKELCHLHAQPSLEQSCHRQKKSFVSMHAGLLRYIQLFATPWTVACQASLSRGFSRQEYWSVLANTGCHTLLEHYISCCPSCQLP